MSEYHFDFFPTFLCAKMLLAKISSSKVTLKMAWTDKIRLLLLLIFNDDRACENRKNCFTVFNFQIVDVLKKKLKNTLEDLLHIDGT